MACNCGRDSLGHDASTTFIVFLILKLTDLIDWSWWWVTSPLWSYFAIRFVIDVLKGVKTGLEREEV